MVRDYELMYIVRPELDEDGLKAATDSVERLISSVGGTVVRSTSWGRRRLAYEVDHLRDGHYMLLHIRADGGRIAEVERALAIHETVFRHLLVLHEAGADVEELPEAPAAVDDEVDAVEDGPRQAPVAGSGDDDTNDDDDLVPAALVDSPDEEES